VIDVEDLQFHNHNTIYMFKVWVNNIVDKVLRPKGSDSHKVFSKVILDRNNFVMVKVKGTLNQVKCCLSWTDKVLQVYEVSSARTQTIKE
jgi:hypothetical protein